MTTKPKWELFFFPPSGENYSPEDALKRLCEVEEQAHIIEKLRIMTGLESWQWPKNWVKQVSGIYQLTSGDFRVYFNLYHRIIIVSHICRKVRQKARVEDINRGKENFDRYKQKMESRSK